MGRFERKRSTQVIVTMSVSAVVATGVGLGVPLIADAAPIPVAVAADGPAPITGGQVRGLANNEVSGAVQAVVPNPTDAAELWVGTVNGGVWHTTNATAASPNWTPTMDDLPETSIGALALDPTIPSNSVLVAGLGNTSSNNRIGSALTGILRTTNAGASWTRLGITQLAGQSFTGIVARGNVIVASSTNGGVWRSTNTGGTFQRMDTVAGSGLPNAVAWDVIGDPGNPQRLYAATRQGVFISNDTGATWTAAGGLNFGLGANVIDNTTNNFKLALHRQGATDALFAGVVNNGQLAGLFRSANQGGAWAAMDIPQTNEGGTLIGLQPRVKPGSQGGVHFSMTADPADANLVYLGGDRQPRPFPNSVGATGFTGRLFRCDNALAAGAQCAPITDNGTANDTGPHADSRDMAFDANGDLIEGDDGGVVRQTNPSDATGDWVSLNGSLQISEHHSCDWDAVADVIICGDQDTGTPEQSAAGSASWRSVDVADGGKVTVDDTGASSIRYSSTQQLGAFQRRTCTAANVCGASVNPTLLVGAQTLFQVEGVTATNNPLPFYNPISANDVEADRLVIGTGTRVYESTDNGNNLTVLSATTGGVNALVYGGRANGSDNPGVLYVGAGNGLFLRSAQAGTLAEINSYPGNAPVGVATDPENWRNVAVVDGTSAFFSSDAGATWQDVTGNLATTDAGAGTLYSVGLIPVAGQLAVVVGGARGTFVTQTQNLGSWATFAPDVPQTLVTATVYDDADDTLLIGTHGRGSFVVDNAAAAIPSANLRVSKSDSTDPVIAGEELFYEVTVTNDGPDPAFGVVVTDQLPNQVDYLSDNDSCTLGLGNKLTCDVGDLANGASKTIRIKTRVQSTTVENEADGTLRIDNTASAASVSVDSDPSNNTAVETTFVQDSADLQVTKVCEPGTTLQAGQTGICTVYVDNVGPSSARSLTLTDANNSEGTFTIGSVTPSAGTCSNTATVVTCTLNKLRAGSVTESGRWSVAIEVSAEEGLEIDDVARVRSETPDPNTGNNQKQDTIVVSAAADLELTKSGPASAIAGTQVTYTLDLTNNGPSAATGVVIEDVLPAAVSIVSVSGTDGATCNGGIPGNAGVPTTCSFGNVAKNGTRSMTVTVEVDPDYRGTLVNSARVASEVFDPDAVNNLGEQQTSVTTEADLGVTIAATPNPVIAGDGFSYLVTVRNNGPSTARNVGAEIPLPNALTYTSSSVALLGSCGLQTNTNTVSCELGDLARGGQAVITIYTTVSPATAQGSVLSTQATIASDTTDTGPTPNSATVNTNVVTSADLEISLTSDALRYRPSKIIHYSIKVGNKGLSDARNVEISQVLPPPKVATYDSNDGGCPAPSGGVFTCSLGTITAGASKTVQLNVLIRGNKRTITQTATVTSTTNDPDLLNNSSTRTVTVR